MKVTIALSFHGPVMVFLMIRSTSDLWMLAKVLVNGVRMDSSQR